MATYLIQNIKNNYCLVIRKSDISLIFFLIAIGITYISPLDFKYIFYFVS